MSLWVLTMSELARESSRDNQLLGVMEAMGCGTWPQELEEFRRVASSLSVAEGILLYGDRVVFTEGRGCWPRFMGVTRGSAA